MTDDVGAFAAGRRGNKADARVGEPGVWPRVEGRRGGGVACMQILAIGRENRDKVVRWRGGTWGGIAYAGVGGYSSGKHDRFRQEKTRE